MNNIIKMKIYNQVGSKERFLEMFQGVTKTKLNENFGDDTNNNSGILVKSFNELKQGSLNINNTNTKSNNNENNIEISGTDQNGNLITFRVRTTTSQGDQDGVFTVDSAELIEFIFRNNTHNVEIAEGDKILQQFNAQHNQELIDVVSEYSDDNSSDVPDMEDGLYEEAINLIDKVPYKKSQETMQTFNKKELDENMNSILHYSQGARDAGYLYPQAKKMGVTNQHILTSALKEIGVDINNIIDNGEKFEISFDFNGKTNTAKLNYNYGSADKVRNQIKKKLGLTENDYVDDDYTRPSKMKDPLAMPTDYSTNPIKKEYDDKSNGIDPWEQELNDYENDNEPTQKLSPKKVAIINQVYDNLVNAGNQFPTNSQVMAEIDKLSGKKPVEKTRTIPRGAEAFYENIDINPVTDYNTDKVMHDQFNNVLSDETKKTIISNADYLLSTHLGSRKDRIPREEYIKKVKEIATQMYMKSVSTGNMGVGLNEEENSDYPDQIGKKFKPKNQMPKKKKKQQAVVKLGENTLTPNENPEVTDAPETNIDTVMQNKEEKGDMLAGGLADDKKPQDFDKEQLALGLKVEMEHASDPMIALEIAMDHLSEDNAYYSVKDDPEASAQANASMEAEDEPSESGFDDDEDSDKEMTDSLLGYKSKNVGDIDEDYDFAGAEVEYDNKDSLNKYKQYSQKDFNSLQDNEKEEYFGLWKQFKGAEDMNEGGSKHIVVFDGTSAYVEDENNVGDAEVKGTFDNIDDAQALADKINDEVGQKMSEANDPISQKQIQIAKKTLKMPDAMIGVMGGMTKKEAVQILIKNNIKY